MKTTLALQPPQDTPPEISPARTEDQVVLEASTVESKVIAANVEFYRQIAQKYDRYETGTFDPNVQQSIEDDLDRIQARLVTPGRMPTCLDCGGGTGNVALKMLERGWRVTVVDVSSEMLGMLKKKARAKGYSPRLIRSSLERFLAATTTTTHDVVTFSAVLHHLHSYERVVRLAAHRVGLGGFFYSNFDPVVPKRPFWARALHSLDTAVAKLAFDPSDFLPGIGRRLRKLFVPRDPLLGRAVASPGDAAEYHALSGLDDFRILQLLRTAGLSVVEHRRYATGRTKALLLLNERLRLLESFKIIARRGHEATQVGLPARGVDLIA